MRYCHLSMHCALLLAVPLDNLAKALAPRWDHTSIKHTWDDVPPNWESLGPPPAGTTIDLNIALTPQNENALIEALYEVSNPNNSRYGEHLSKEQVARLVAPHQDTLELVHSWLGSHGIPSSSISMTHEGRWLTLTGVPVARANELLGASYQLYRHTVTNDTAILRTIGYSLPTALHAHVRTVVPTTYFFMGSLWQTPQISLLNATADMTPRELGKMLSSRANNLVTPSVLRSLYRMAEYVPAAVYQNLFGVTAFLNQYPSPTDFTKFMTDCRSDAIDPVFVFVPVNGGGYNPNDPGKEANSNIQYAAALTYPTPLIFYSIGGDVKFEPPGISGPAKGDVFLEWLLFVLNKLVVPMTVTMSYSILEKYVPQEYATTICDMFAELGARGSSVLIASGNDGVGKGGQCSDGSGRHTFLTEFPPTCPYVTTVGGTTGQPETAAIFSGGGFSQLFDRPEYQDVVVPEFLQRLGGQYNGLFNAEGRAIPDISAQASNYYFVRNNLAYGASGTSLAAPTVASIITLLNDYRLSTGRNPLGFLNPWLYSHGRTGMNDIKSGSNPGCNTEGFSAIAGWDPVTGLGTPDFLLLQYTLDYIPTPPGPGN